MGDKILKATHGGPLVIAGITIPAFVLEDGTRVLSQRGLCESIGLSTGGASKAGAHRIESFLARIDEKGIEVSDLMARIQKTIEFKPPHGGRTAFGNEATILADICDAVFDAEKKDALLPQQKHIAKRCEILMRGFAKVGIIALVDEATGYQEVRDRIALQKILDKYLLAEYAKWAKRFPDEFYELMFKFKGWQWKGMSVNRPSVVGRYTNDLVYERLAPGLLAELKRLNPPDEHGRRKTKFQQWLTEDIGHPALQKHLAILIAFMRAAPNWGVFHRNVERALPKLGETIPMALDED